MEGKLQLVSYIHPRSLLLSTLEQLINACGLVTKQIVEINDDLPIGPRLVLLGNRLGPTLRELTISVSSISETSAADAMVYVAQQARSLTSLDLSAPVGFSDVVVKKLAMACQQLRCLKLNTIAPCVLSTAAINALFANCRQLQHVKLPITAGIDQAKLMKAILDNRVRLKSFIGLSDSSWKAFRKLVKKFQLLPVYGLIPSK